MDLAFCQYSLWMQASRKWPALLKRAVPIPQRSKRRELFRSLPLFCAFALGNLVVVAAYQQVIKLTLGFQHHAHRNEQA